MAVGVGWTPPVVKKTLLRIVVFNQCRKCEFL